MSNVTVTDPKFSADGKPAGRLLEVEDRYVDFRTRDGVATVSHGVH